MAPAQKTNLLLTGLPGVGKTTVVRRVADRLRGINARGFLTEEIREGGARKGFRITSLDGRTAVLSHVDVRGRPRVGRYGVDVRALASISSSAMAVDDSIGVYLIDEIGKMECLSDEFVDAAEALLAGPAPVVATIARKGGGFIARARDRDDVDLWEVTRENRDGLPERVLIWIENHRG
jgi:nucleoside-triphosphatase